MVGVSKLSIINNYLINILLFLALKFIIPYATVLVSSSGLKSS